MIVTSSCFEAEVCGLFIEDTGVSPLFDFVAASPFSESLSAILTSGFRLLACGSTLESAFISVASTSVLTAAGLMSAPFDFAAVSTPRFTVAMVNDALSDGGLVLLASFATTTAVDLFCSASIFLPLLAPVLESPEQSIFSSSSVVSRQMTSDLPCVGDVLELFAVTSVVVTRLAFDTPALLAATDFPGFGVTDFPDTADDLPPAPLSSLIKFLIQNLFLATGEWRTSSNTTLTSFASSVDVALNDSAALAFVSSASKSMTSSPPPSAAAGVTGLAAVAAAVATLCPGAVSHCQLLGTGKSLSSCFSSASFSTIHRPFDW